MAMPGQAHWADLSTAEITIQSVQTLPEEQSGGYSEAQIALTYPTKLTAFADDDTSGQLSDEEVNRHRAQLQTFLQDRIRLQDSQGQIAALSVSPRSGVVGVVSPSGQAAPKTHTGLQLNYTWPTAVQDIEIDYNLFISEAPKATCLATISQAGEFTSHVFTPKKTTLALTPGGILNSGKWALTLIGVFAWGAAHSLSPGHGKTLVGAYLVGERATPLHAVFLAMVTTVTHTLGVFALGLITLFAARYILPEQLYPWLSLLSGSMVIAIGANLLWQRWRRHASKGGSHGAHDHGHTHHHHSGHDAHSHSGHSHSHGERSHSHQEHSHGGHSHHEHSHGGHSHSHLPAQDGEPVTWRSLLFLGLSAGLVPCPAALVLLLERSPLATLHLV